MDLQPNKIDGIYLPITDTRISASEWNQLVGSCMAFITEAGLTPDAEDNEQFLNAFKTIAAGLEIVGANTNLSNLTATGEARFTTKANTDLSNLTSGLSNTICTTAATTTSTASSTTPAVVVENYVNGTSWYRVWSDGWCEQGGYSTSSSVTFLQQMANTNYNICLTSYRNGLTSSGDFRYITSYSTTGFSKDLDTDETFWWRVEGQKGS